MKRTIAALALAASLVFAPQALAHHPVGSAEQACTKAEEITLTASFSNPGFDEETTVTATDSGGADLGPAQQSPATFSATFKQTDRPAGTVTFNWQAEHDSGSVSAPYEAVSGCVPVTTTTTTVPPPPPPSHHHTHIGTAQSRHSQPSPPTANAPAPPGVQNGQLPFSGLPVLPMAILGGLFLGAGLALWRYA